MPQLDALVACLDTLARHLVDELAELFVDIVSFGLAGDKPSYVFIVGDDIRFVGCGDDDHRRRPVAADQCGATIED